MRSSSLPRFCSICSLTFAPTCDLAACPAMARTSTWYFKSSKLPVKLDRHGEPGEVVALLAALPFDVATMEAFTT